MLTRFPCVYSVYSQYICSVYTQYVLSIFAAHTVLTDLGFRDIILVFVSNTGFNLIVRPAMSYSHIKVYSDKKIVCLADGGAVRISSSE